jgi:hypothetical protein
VNLFNLPDLGRALLFAVAVWFLAHSLAAAFTITEPEIDDMDRKLRLQQAVHLGLVAGFFALWFRLSL